MSIRRSEIAVKTAALSHAALGTTCSKIGAIGAGYLQDEGDNGQGEEPYVLSRAARESLHSSDDYKAAALAAFSPKLPKVHHVYVYSISSNVEFASLVRDMSLGRYYGRDELMVSERLMPLCFACFSESEKLLAPGEGESVALEAARAQIEELNFKINSCNLSAMKQIEAMRIDGESRMEDELHQFYEPLRYMSEETRELVLLCMVQKLRQVENGVASGSTMQSLVDLVASIKAEKHQKDKEEEELRIADAVKAETRELQWKLKAAEERLSSLKEMVHKSREAHSHGGAELQFQESESMQLKHEAATSELKAKLATTEALLADVKQELQVSRQELLQVTAQLTESREQLQRQADDALQQKLKLEAAQKEVEMQGKEVRETRERVSQMEKDKEAYAAEKRKLTTEVAKYKAKVEEEERRRASGNHAAAQTDVGGKEVAAMFAARGELLSAEVQTEVAGEEVEKAADENAKLKVALEEMKAKLKEMVDALKKKGVDVSHVESAFAKSGLKKFMRCGNIFERLYEDAIARIHRLEALRETYRLEKEKRAAVFARQNVVPPELVASDSDKLTPSSLRRAVLSPDHGFVVRSLIAEDTEEQRQGQHHVSTWWADEVFKAQHSQAAAISPTQRALVSGSPLSPDQHAHRVRINPGSPQSGWPGGGFPGGRFHPRPLGQSQSLPLLREGHAAAAQDAAAQSRLGGRRHRADR